MLKIKISSIFYSNSILMLGLLTLSLGFFSILSYSVSLANFIVLYLFYYYLKSNYKTIIVIYLILISYLISIAFLFIESLNIIEFLKSFLLTSLMLFVFLSSLVKPLFVSKNNLVKILSYVAVFIVLFELVQVCEYIFFGSSKTWFILDNFSISTATDIGRFQAVNLLTFMRPISFYHEPSYLGIVLLILLICANQVVVSRFIIYAYYIGILVSFSTTALAFLVLYILYNNFEKLKSAILLILTVGLLFTFLIDNETLDTIFRFNEIFNAGTSGNQRLLGPYDYLINQFVVKHHYFGIPLGQSDLVFNNSFYLLFLYFGVFTPVLLLIFILYIFSKFKFDAFKYLIAFFSLLFLNGALFTPEAALLLYFLNLSFLIRRNENLAISTV